MAKPLLTKDEMFIPRDKKGGKGIILQLGELQRNGRTVVEINQYQAMREAQREEGYVLSAAEDWEVVGYVHMHRDDNPASNKFYEGLHRYARWTRTQVHNLRTSRPLVLNIARVHPTLDCVVAFEDEVVEAPWLPKKAGYIQAIDKRTGLPREVGEKPNKRFYNTYFSIDPEKDVVAAVRSGSSVLGLGLYGEPSLADDWLGVRVAKNFSAEKIKKR